MKLLGTLSCLFFFLTACVNSQEFLVNGDRLRNLLLVGENVLAGSETMLYRLDYRSLKLQQSANLTGVNRLLLKLNDTGSNGDVLSCQEQGCSLFASSNLVTEITVELPSNPSSALDTLKRGVDDLVGIFSTDQSFFVAREELTSDDPRIPSTVSKLGYTSDSDSLDLSLVGKQVEENIFFFRRFLATFKDDVYVYFVYELPQEEEESDRLRIGRNCAGDTGGSSQSLTTYTEVKLECEEGLSSSSASIVTIDGYLMILVAGYSGSGSTANVICSFNVTEINQAMDEKLDRCKIGKGFIDLERTGSNSMVACPSDLSEVQRNQITQCSRPGTIATPLGVENLITGKSILSFSSSVVFHSLASFTYDEIVYVLAGTSGVIEQFFYSGDSLERIRSINVTASTAIEEIHISDDNEFYYILTDSSVERYPINVCGQLTSCQSCVLSLDPLCGWCTLSSSCTKRSDCTTAPQIWTTSDDKCPFVNSVEPSFVYTHQLDDSSLFFTLDYSNIPNITYDCVYQFEGLNNPSTAVAQVVDNETIVCPLPSVESLPDFNGSDTLTAELSLRTVDSVDVVQNQTVQFTNCSTQTMCFSCLDSANRCRWCPSTGQCFSELQECPSQAMSIIGTSPQDSCPFILPPEDNDNYLIHNLLQQELVIRAKNVQNFQSLMCILTDTASNVVLYRIPSTEQNSTHIICDETNFNVSLNSTSTLLEASLRVEFNDVIVENPNEAKAIFYSCPLIGTNCGHCLSIESMFNCGYCLGTGNCLFSSLCSEPPLRGINTINQCETPTITSFSPMAGPIQGGTRIVINGENLGARSSQISKISIMSVECDQIEDLYEPGRRIYCTTEQTTTSIFNGAIEIEFTFGSISSLQEYRFLIPQLSNQQPADPSIGPLAGGTRVTINGQHLGIGSRRTITMAGQPCTIENEDNISFDTRNITCITTKSNSTTIRGQGAVTVTIDNHGLSALGFDYDNNPTFSSISPTFSFESGGTVLTVKGNDLDTIQEPLLLFYLDEGLVTKKRAVYDYTNPIESTPCFDIEDEEMKCHAPQLSGISLNGSLVVRIGLKMDNVVDLLTLPVNITVHRNPSFSENNQFSLGPGVTRNLTIDGTGFFFDLSQIQIMVDEIGVLCRPVQISSTEVVCEIEIESGTSEGQYDMEATVGQYTQPIGTLSVQEPFNPLITIISSFAVLVVVVVVAFIVFFSIFYRKYKLKGRQNDFLMLELDRLESNMAQECKLGFAELQTDIDELTGDLTGSRLPYHDFHVYLLQSLFPGAKDHPVLHELQLPQHKKAQTERALKDFHGLVLDKTVLLTIIQAMEGQRAFTIRDKSNMGSLLMLALHNRLDYATDILKRLLSTLVRKTVSESYPKLLLRRTESVAEKMLSSWLAFTLHGFVVEHAGQPLYRLFKAVKAQLQKGPVDVITGEARYSLSEQKLVRQQLDVQVINATVEAEDGLQIPVKLLDCDSISQAKEKMLDAVHKNAPVSQRPALTDVDIEYRRTPKEDGTILRDEDGSNSMEYGWRKINTLSHYWIPDRAVFRLIPRLERPSQGRVFDYTGSLMVTHGYRNRSISDAEDGYRVWHLLKQHDEDPRSSPFISKKLVTEIYLPRMLSTKTILQSFVDDLFNSIFTLSHPPISPSQLYTPINATFSPILADQGYAPGTDSLPVPIKYLFDFLDDEAASSKITDSDVLHTWKNNSLALRFWVNLIKNPEFVFDINKSAIVDSCLSVIAQAFIDGCSSSDTKPTINSPTSKLLFNKEVQGYKTNVKKYYEQISDLPRVPEEMMMRYLKDLSAHQEQLMGKSGDFHIESALYEIMRYCIKYQEAILEALRSSGLESKAQLLDSAIHRCMQ